MTIKTEEQEIVKDKVIDDITEDVNLDKLAALKAKLGKKEDVVPPKIVQEKKRSLKFGVIGTGQAGSRLAEQFFQVGYDTVVCNTAPQDLAHINIPESNKLLLEYGFGGAAKELDIGHAAAETHRAALNELIQLKLSDAQLFVLTLSLGGGSGAGSCETIVDILNNIGKPVVIIAVLPMENDDAQTKSNSLETLAKIAKLTQSNKVQNIMLVDNAKIETIFSDVSQLHFYDVANKAIVEPIDMFNTLSAQPSPSKALDSTEWAKLLVDGGGLSTIGSMTIREYEEETAIAEAVINNLNNNLLSGGFDLKQSRYAGFIVAANKKVWEKIPSASINYAAALIQEQCGTPKALFRGIYVTDDADDCVKVYSMFSGLLLPTSRIEALKKDAKELMQQAKSKDEGRSLNLQLDTGTNDTVSAAQKVKDKIASKASAFGKFFGGSIDKRK